jgi:hypothetical protein
VTDAEIIEQFDELVPTNDLSDTLKIQLANNAKNKLETDLRLAVCEKLDTSLTSTVGGTYTTAYNLQSDFLMLSKDIIYVGTTQRTGIPFAHRERYKSDSSKFYIDHRQNKLYLCGTVQTAETITIPYICETDDITAATVEAETTSVIWPPRFHSIIPFEMVKIQYPIDAGEKGRSWMPEWSALYNEYKNSLINWDSSLKLSAIGGVTPYGMDANESGEYQINLS